jgi:type IV pilus assembly protein PilW
VRVIHDTGRANNRVRLRTQKGFSIVELMVAMLLGLVLLGGVINIFLTNQQSFRTNEDLGRLQENARTSFELMARELRQAGGNTCGASLTANVLNNAGTNWAVNWDAGVLQGFESGVAATGIVNSGTGVAERVSNTDAIKVLSGSLLNGLRFSSHDGAAARFTLADSGFGFSVGDVVMACDGESAAVTRLTAVGAGSPTTLDHLEGAGTTDNCSRGLRFPSDCTQPTGNVRNFSAGGYISPLSASTWYIGNNPRGGRSLYRLTPGGAAEIAEGVIDMQIDYLLRDTAGVLGNDWINPATTFDWSPTSADGQIVAVRVRLQLQSANAVGTDQAPLRRELIHVVNLRNRSP